MKPYPIKDNEISVIDIVVNSFVFKVIAFGMKLIIALASIRFCLWIIEGFVCMYHGCAGKVGF